MSATTRVLLCGCSNKYQDERYGQGRRVHNMTKQQKRMDERFWRCTVCLREKPITQ